MPAVGSSAGPSHVAGFASMLGWSRRREPPRGNADNFPTSNTSCFSKGGDGNFKNAMSGFSPCDSRLSMRVGTEQQQYVPAIAVAHCNKLTSLVTCGVLGLEGSRPLAVLRRSQCRSSAMRHCLYFCPSKLLPAPWFLAGLRLCPYNPQPPPFLLSLSEVQLVPQGEQPSPCSNLN